MQGGVIQVLAGAPMGGAEAFFERLTMSLHRSGVPQKLVIRTNPRRSGLLRDAGLDVVELPFGGIADLVTRWSLRREIARYKPSVVLAWMNRAAWSCPAGKGRFACVGRLGHYYKMKYYRSCDHLIGITPEIVEWIVSQGWNPDRVHYIPNFVNVTPAAPLERSSLGVPEGKPLLLAMGRLHENKGFDILIRSMKQIPDTWLLLAGAGPLRDDLGQLAEAEGVADRVRFLGWRDDIPALLATADVFVCPSRHEGMGSIILEAWAHGVPIVATASQGPKSLISDGKTGVLTPIDDVGALTQAIRRMLTDTSTAAMMAAAGKITYEEGFNEESIVRRYRAFFEKVAP